MRVGFSQILLRHLGILVEAGLLMFFAPFSGSRVVVPSCVWDLVLARVCLLSVVCLWASWLCFQCPETFMS